MRYPDLLPPKKDVTRGLLLRGAVFVHLDPRAEGAMVPPWLRHQPQLVLQVGLDMPIPIPDLKIDDEGVYGTLSFNRAPFTCAVPWTAVFAVVGEDGRGMVWPESMPAEIRAEVERETGETAPAEVAPGPPSVPPRADEDVEAEPDGAGGETGAEVVDLTERRARGVPAGEAPPAETPPEGTPAPAVRSKGRARGRKQGRPLPPYLRVVK